ncbi:MAG TPA: oligopeptide/dipeptide ABC transporter ATP-binding protein [Bryobacteraceae bacterium]|nr:oligopeptide/dipeptide ABC transporter ATP-binding protein [Bryobacteraceae bacterium]
MSDPLLSVRNLAVHFRLQGHRSLYAVDGVSFDIPEGETLGLVGESGCGKTTLGRAILRVETPTSGEVRYRNQPLSDDMRPFRRHMQMIFQDPYASLNPRMRVGSIIAEPIRALGLRQNGDSRRRVEQLMDLVGLHPRFATRYPHEFSGGQRQRIGIARVLAAQPDFVIADEPISALDVSIQAQILNLLERLQRELKLTLLFISHDLRAVRHISDRICVMYLGKLVEIAPAAELYARPLMPYTKALISAVPVIGPERSHRRMVLTGDVPSPVDPPSGCRFRTRCPYAIEECSQVVPVLREIRPEHWAACIRIGPDEPDIDAVL